LRISLLVLAALQAGPLAVAATAAPVLQSSEAIASAGYYRLSWESTTQQVELQEDTVAGFNSPRTYYNGTDRAVVLSGKPDGVWYYRARALNGTQPGPWSETVAVTIAHHKLSRALVFFGLGLVVFIATTLMILRASVSAR